MAINIASLNARGLRDSSCAARVLRSLIDFQLDVVALQETHFASSLDERVFRNHFDVFSSYGIPSGRGVSLLIRQSLEAVVNVVFRDDEGRLLVADLKIDEKQFRIVIVHAPCNTRKRRNFLTTLEPYLTDPKRTISVGDWNSILDPEIDRAGKGNGGNGWSGNPDDTLINFIAEHRLVDRYRHEHPKTKVWTWTNSNTEVVTNRSYLDRFLVRRADVDFLSCPSFEWVGQSDHKLVMARLRISKTPKLDSYWKFNSSLLKIRDFRDKLEELIQKNLVGAVTGSRWWVSLKRKIRDFTVKYSQQLAIDKAEAVKATQDSLTRAVAGGNPLDAAIARSDLVRAANERYQGQVVRARCNRVSNEAVKLDASLRREEFHRHENTYITQVKSSDGRSLESSREMLEEFRSHFQTRSARLPDLPVEQFNEYLAGFPRLTDAAVRGDGYRRRSPGSA